MEPKTIAERAAKLGFPAVALTDRNGLYGAMPFSDACIAKGVQPIIGAMLGVARPAGDRRRRRGDRLAGAARQGRARAMPISASWSRRRISTGRSRRSRTSRFAALEGLSDGLIALTAGGEGALARLIADGQHAKAEAYLDRLQALFPERLYVEISAARRRGRGSSGRGADRSRLCPRPAARRDQPRGLSPTRASTPRTTRCCASPTRPMSKAPTASPRRPTPGSRTARRWPSCSPTCPRRSPTPRSSPSAARSRRRSASRSCRGSGEDEDEQLRRDARAGLAARLAGRDPARTSSSAYLERLDFELDVITGMGFRRLLPDRRRLHQMGQGQRHSGRAGPRFGRRLGRRLGADHHRPRPDRARPAVRALPQPRARVDARLRHRFLRNPPRQGHPLRPGASTAATRSPRSSPSGG